MAASDPKRSASPLSPEAFATAAAVSRETVGRLEAYLALLEKWQLRINLVARDSLDDPWRRHMLDSAQLARHIPDDARTLVDLGSGAGFPGLVLAILLGRDTHLIESDGRKCVFLQEAVRVTGAAVTIHQARIESLDPWPADIVTARALAPLAKLIDLAAPFVGLGADSTGKCLFLKGARVEEELTEAKKSWNMEVERISSLTDDGGTILKLGNLSRV